MWTYGNKKTKSTLNQGTVPIYQGQDQGKYIGYTVLVAMHLVSVNIHLIMKALRKFIQI